LVWLAGLIVTLGTFIILLPDEHGTKKGPSGKRHSASRQKTEAAQLAG
jgi:hypothetical protein